jgi:hypothetical protein
MLNLPLADPSDCPRKNLAWIAKLLNELVFADSNPQLMKGQKKWNFLGGLT